MPLAAKNNLDELYAKQRIVQREAERLEQERDALDPESRALWEESTKLGSTISDILERDLQR